MRHLYRFFFCKNVLWNFPGILYHPHLTVTWHKRILATMHSNLHLLTNLSINFVAYMVNRFIAVFQLKYFVVASCLVKSWKGFPSAIVFIVRLLDNKLRNFSGLALVIWNWGCHLFQRRKLWECQYTSMKKSKSVGTRCDVSNSMGIRHPRHPR